MAYYLSQKKTKNLIRYPYAYLSYGNVDTIKDVNVTINADRSITLNGVASGDGTINLHSTPTIPLTYGLETVVLSMTTVGNYSGNVYLQMASSDGVSSYTNWSSVVTPGSKPVVYKYTVYLCNLYFKAGTTFDNFTVYPMLNEGAEALPYEEPIDYKRIKESNLLDLSSQTIRSSSKIRITQYGNILVFKGTLNEWQTIIDPFQLDCLEQGKTYTLSCNQYYAYGKVGVRAKLQVKSKTDNSIVTTYEGYSGKITFTVDNKQYAYYLMIQGGSTKGKFNQKLQWMLNEGSTEKTFKQYHPDFNEPVKIITRTSNLFNAKKIANTNIQVNEDGSQIIMPLSTGNGLAYTNTDFKTLCPEVKVGDVIYFRFSRLYTDGKVGSDILNRYIYFLEAGTVWSWTIGALTVTDELLNSRIGLYGNRATDGETKQVILKDFRITREANAPFEPYNQLYRVRSGVLIRNPKNLIPLPYSFADKTQDGIMRKKNQDGSITFTGTATIEWYLTIARYKVGELPVGTYYSSGSIYNGNVMLAIDGYRDGKWAKSLSYSNKKFMIDFNGYDTVAIFAYIKKDTTVDCTIYPMLNEGTTAEPYFIYD